MYATIVPGLAAILVNARMCEARRSAAESHLARRVAAVAAASRPAHVGRGRRLVALALIALGRWVAGSGRTRHARCEEPAPAR